MDQEYEAQYHALEEAHWWFAGRRQLVYGHVAQLPKTAHILEIGCSGGPLLLLLRQAGFSQLQGIDVSDAGIALARQRGFARVQVMDATHTQFADMQFDAIVASDVLEHIAEENTALRDWWRILKPGGKLYVYVPAYPLLWSPHDVANHHHRRYTAHTLKTALQRADFQILRSSYWNCILLPPVMLVRLVKRLLPAPKTVSSDLQRPHPLVNTILLRLLLLENWLLKRMNLPFGISVWAVAQKPAR